MSELSGKVLSDQATGLWPPASLPRESLVKNPIRTDRLMLRPLETADADDVWRYQRDAEILRYIPWPERTREEAREHTERRATASGSLACDGDHLFLAVEPTTGPRGHLV